MKTNDVKHEKSIRDEYTSNGPIFLEMYHAPFCDGTPRCPLLSIELTGRPRELAEEILEHETSCETDGIANYWWIDPTGDHREAIANLMKLSGVVGSIWVEYALKTNIQYHAPHQTQPNIKTTTKEAELIKAIRGALENNPAGGLTVRQVLELIVERDMV